VPGDTLSRVGPFRTVNIGASQPVELEEFIAAIERALGRRAKKTYVPMQPGDVRRTYASTELLHRLTGTRPSISLEQGVAAFADWYLSYRAERCRPGAAADL
jgi:UDP-glucuronate 4-epimerase